MVGCIHCFSVPMLFSFFLSLSAGIDPALAMMVCLALLIALLSVNGFAYFVRYIFLFFFIYTK